MLLVPLTIGGVAGVSSYAHHHPLGPAQEVGIHVPCRLFLFVPTHTIIGYLGEGAHQVANVAVKS